MRTRLFSALIALTLPAAALAQSGIDSDDPQVDPTFPSWEEEETFSPPPPPPPGSEQPVSQTPPEQQSAQPSAQQPAAPVTPPPAQPAQPQPQVTVIQNQSDATTQADESESKARASDRDDRGIVVMGQAGVLTYTGEAASVTRPGSTYGVAVGLDLTRGITTELGYLGASYRTESDNGSVGMTENGAQALVQLGPQQRDFHPFAMFGLQLSRVNALERGDVSPEVRDATHLKLPMGAGINYTVPSDADAEITVGARAAYNFTLDAGAFPTLNEPAAANQFTGMAVVGGRF